MGKVENETILILLGLAVIVYLASKRNTTNFIGSNIEAQEGFMADTMGKVLVPVNSYNFYDKQY